MPPPHSDITSLCPSCGYDIRGLNFVEEKATCPECGWKIDRTLLRGVPEIAYPFRISVGFPLAIFSLAVVIFITAKYVSGFDDVSRRVEDTLAVLVLATLLAGLNIPPFIFARKNRARYRAIPRDRRHLWSQGVMFVIGSVAVVVVVVFFIISAIAARGS